MTCFVSENQGQAFTVNMLECRTSEAHNLREFVRTAVILTPAREASRVGTALRRQDPVDPVDPVECSFLLEFETPIEVERSEDRI